MGPILVVEDSAAAREIVVRILRREGYEVASAASALEALRYIEREKPSLMLLDVMMPGMDGMTLMQRMKSLPEASDIPVIFLSALSDEQRMRKAREMGAAAYLVKTRFSYDELIEQVGRHIRS